MDKVVSKVYRTSIGKEDLAVLRDRNRLVEEVAEEINALHYARKFLQAKYLELVDTLAEKYGLEDGTCIDTATGKIEGWEKNAVQLERTEDTVEGKAG